MKIKEKCWEVLNLLFENDDKSFDLFFAEKTIKTVEDIIMKYMVDLSKHS